MTTTPLEGDLAQLVAEVATTPVAVDADTDLLLSGVVDSLGVVRIVHWLEDRLGIEIDAADVTLDNFASIGAIARYVARRCGSAA